MDESEMVDATDVPVGISIAADRPSGKTLTHAQIWDDSALVDAWDAAMEEAKEHCSHGTGANKS